MIISYGSEEYTRNRETLIHYNFFDDPFENGRDAVFGLDKPADGAGAHLPIGRTPLRHRAPGAAAARTGWHRQEHHRAPAEEGPGSLLAHRGWPAVHVSTGCPMMASAWTARCTKSRCTWSRPSCVSCAERAAQRADQPNGDRVEIEASCARPAALFQPAARKSRRELAGGHPPGAGQAPAALREGPGGIGTFQPKDEKNQDSTELTGDINYRKIAEYGSDSDPRAFNFDGELNIANRGLVEFIEILKLDVAFLYDLLTASQEHKIKPKKFAHTDIDEVILGHTNEAEYRRLLNNEYMEALRDRTIKIDIPYVTRFSDEVKIYERDFNERRVVGQAHRPAHPGDRRPVGRADPPGRAQARRPDPAAKAQAVRRALPARLHRGQRDRAAGEAKQEGMQGISPATSRISSRTCWWQPGAPASTPSCSCASWRPACAPLAHHQRGAAQALPRAAQVVRGEYDEIVKNEVQRAITADEAAIKRLCANYIDNIKAYTQKQKVRNPYTGQDELPTSA
jgi:serine protein kinase